MIRTEPAATAIHPALSVREDILIFWYTSTCLSADY